MSQICISTIGGSFTIGDDWMLRSEAGEIKASQYVAQWKLGEAPERVTFPQIVEVEKESDIPGVGSVESERKMMVTVRSLFVTFIAEEHDGDG